jgi:hypothetical protein
VRQLETAIRSAVHAQGTRRRSLPQGGLVAALGLASLASACGPAGGGGGGDQARLPSGNAFGDGARLAELVGPATWLNPDDVESVACSKPGDRSVQVSGLTVTAVDRFDETGDGAFGNLYAQDPVPAPYAGITVFDPGFSPPDLRLFPGDRVDFQGTLTEFLGPSTGPFGGCKTLPELLGAMSLRFDGVPPEPYPVTLDDLVLYEDASGPEAPLGARKLIGLLVRLENVAISGTPSNSGGRYTANIDVGAGVPFNDVPRISNELYDLEAEGPPLADGTTFSSVTGIVTYFYGFKIVPRSPADFVP